MNREATVKTVIVGLGNPLLSDDGVGIRVARLLAGELAGRHDTTVLELGIGGLRLMEALQGYQRAILIDALVGGEAAAGTIQVFAPGPGMTARHLPSSHDLDLETALAMGSLLGMSLPEEISIWGVTAQDVATFGEDLSPAVAAAVPRVAAAICRQLTGEEVCAR